MPTQPSAKGEMSYRVSKDTGTIRLVGKEDEEENGPQKVRIVHNYVNARLEDGKLVVRVGSTALIDETRVINREYIIDAPNQDIEKALETILEATREAVEHQVITDAHNS